MLRPLLFEERAREGEYVDQKRFDMRHVSARLRELEREYGVSYDPDCPVPGDPSLAKSVYEAGLVFAEETGLLLVDENRVARFSGDEIREAVRLAPRELLLGRGRDARRLRARRPGDRDKPFIFAGLAGTPTPLEVFYATALSYAREPLVDAIDHGSVNEVFGVKVKSGAPSEALAGIEELRAVRKAVEDAGRPGMHILGAESSVTATASLAAMAAGLLGEGDAQLLPILNEMKTDYSQLTKALVGAMRGVHGAALIDPVVGGFARGPAGSSITAVAETVLSLLAYDASYFLIHPVHITRQATTTPECLWVEAVVGQANTSLGLPLVADVWPANGAGAPELLYEVAANTVAAVASGLNLLGPTPTAGTAPHGTGLEARLMAEVAVKTARDGLKPGDACEAVKELYGRYRGSLEKPSPGKPFTELYDARRVAPRSEWLEAYRRVRAELADMGLVE